MSGPTVKQEIARLRARIASERQILSTFKRSPTYQRLVEQGRASSSYFASACERSISRMQARIVALKELDENGRTPNEAYLADARKERT